MSITVFCFNVWFYGTTKFDDGLEGSCSSGEVHWSCAYLLRPLSPELGQLKQSFKSFISSTCSLLGTRSDDDPRRTGKSVGLAGRGCSVHLLAAGFTLNALEHASVVCITKSQNRACIYPYGRQACRFRLLQRVNAHNL